MKTLLSMIFLCSIVSCALAQVENLKSDTKKTIKENIELNDNKLEE
jgi:hypothetical protein